MSNLREQHAIHTYSSDRHGNFIPQRVSAMVEQRHQLPDVPPASRHRAGHSAGFHPEDQPYATDPPIRRRMLPPPVAEDADEDLYPQRTRSSSIRRRVTTVPVPVTPPKRPWHPLVRLGLISIAIVACTTMLLIVPPVYQRWQDDLHYGYPRTYQTDAVVGHGDSAAHPSHFITLNWHGHLEVIELAGGDPSKATIYAGPTLYQQDADLVPVTLSFEDVDHDGTPDLMLHFEGQLVVFLNNGKTFQGGHP